MAFLSISCPFSVQLSIKICLNIDWNRCKLINTKQELVALFFITNKPRSHARHAFHDNELFYMDKTMMVFGDAKKVIEDMVKAVE
jgi:hypothetical protein